ncbi:MAG TPA: PilZ domain-containing protein [Candidatus Solibacter sp.]|nr:PilZ domain-containing protein [Candidatus Solibacter sp.]
MSTIDLHSSRLNLLRRSQRVCLSVPVEVLKKATGKNPGVEEARTLVVSTHGALLVLSLPVKAEDTLTLKHSKTGEEISCRVVNVGPDQSGKREIGVEFEHPCPRFWRIAFPPPDWNPHNIDAKAPTAHRPTPRPLPNKSKKIPDEADKKSANKTTESAPI